MEYLEDQMNKIEIHSTNLFQVNNTSKQYNI